MRIFGSVVGNNNSGALDIRRLKVAEEIVFIAFIDRGNPVVTNKGLSKDKNLAFV